MKTEMERIALIDRYSTYLVEAMDLNDLMAYVKTGIEQDMSAWSMEEVLEEVNYMAPDLLEENK
jgi:hypothetical protein